MSLFSPSSTRPWPLRALGWVSLAYMCAGLGAALFLWGYSASPLWGSLYADLIATLVVFGFSLAFRNASFYDPYWSLIPIGLACYWGMHPAWEGHDGRIGLSIVLVSAWGLRLSYNWARGWKGLQHEDWRYGMLREKTGTWYPAVNLLGIHMFPTLMVWINCLPLWVISQSTQPLGWLDGLACSIMLAAIVIEASADWQLWRFRTQNEDPEAILSKGLWAWSRHPNYLGEISFWFGLACLGFAASPGSWALFLPPLAMLAMFVWISIPMIDKRMRNKRPAYAAHQKRISALIPKPPKQ